VCCSVLQCVAVCGSVLQCVAVCCSVLQCVAVCYSVLQCVAVCCSVLQCVAVCCSVCCSGLQWVAVCTSRTVNGTEHIDIDEWCAVLVGYFDLHQYESNHTHESYCTCEFYKWVMSLTRSRVTYLLNNRNPALELGCMPRYMRHVLHIWILYMSHVTYSSFH